MEAAVRGLVDRLVELEHRVRAAVAARRRVDPDPDDPVRGLYISEDEVQRLLDRGAPDPLLLRTDEVDGQLGATGDGAGRLARLGGSFGLSALELGILLVALAPDLDPRFEPLYAYLNDDVTRRRATVGLAFELLGVSPLDAGARARLRPDGPLRHGRLLMVEQGERPFLGRELRIPDRVTAHLLGDDTAHPIVERLRLPVVTVETDEREHLSRALRSGTCCYVLDRPDGVGRELGAAALEALGVEVLVVDLDRADGFGVPEAATIVREARLTGAGLLAVALDAVDEDAAVGRLAAAPVPTVLVGRGPWEPRCPADPPLVVTAPRIAPGQVWTRAGAEEVDGGDGTETLGATMRLSPTGARRVLAAARERAALDGRPPDREDLAAAARATTGGRLEGLAVRRRPSADFDDLVLPATTMADVRALIDRATHQATVLDRWGLGARRPDRRGVAALFAGRPGTGKTLAAEVVAGALGVDLYRVDLATVVDKYVGETEKNLERIFTAAEGVPGVLFFDEADALFGKRSAVSDARDRWANIEVAYLLQRIERFHGVVVLATNLRGNLDEAFTRRLDVLVDFPEPDETGRGALWSLHLPPSVPCDPDVDLDGLAARFELTGGGIRNAALTAAYAAAADGGVVTMEHLVAGVAAEYRKQGRLSEGTGLNGDRGARGADDARARR